MVMFHTSLPHIVTMPLYCFNSKGRKIKVEKNPPFARERTAVENRRHMFVALVRF
jgi:hypothetical protein